MTELLLLLGVAVLVAANGFFVAAEFALVRARASKVDDMAEEGLRGAGLAALQIDSIDEYLSACQLGITMASLGIGFMGEPAIATLIEDLLGGSVSHGVSLATSLAVAYIITTALHITFGEQVPKIYSITHAEATARRTARLLELFRVTFKPLIWALNTASNAMLRAIGVNAKAEFDEASSSEDLKLLIAQSQSGGKLDPGEAGMLSGVFHLHEQQARQVMTPIPAVVTIDITATAEAALRRCVDSGHTRLVVTEQDNTDRIKGIVHNNSLARRLMNEGPDSSIAPSIKDALIVPETKPLDDLLADLQRERASLAVVVDEYGRTAGIVSVEDIVEEVVGEIADETDPAVAGVRRLANGDWWVRGHVPITDLEDYEIKLPVDSDAYNSVGGFVFGQLGRLPKRGDMVRANGYSLRVESVRENRIEAVRIRDHGTGPSAEQPEPREATEGA
ncbi:MAG TPA: hemolysin family protein [Thermoleophilaceae bacterium]|nr:hemolysin family protein [Thermoleophilaceae bacterium]